ncbi:DUF4126 domain-containing protein [Sphingobium phenoxybenzoativorans]|uniref:DUF4126 domain-containing protein n=1 Tax=Sphingobium phenoxybenzoativorans TaxID=1592790 RepID=A0A975Q0K3_9SPHN|nr:DUF4126 domain-containing protein [Sphingobium phenoxybenzoativorans]QUT04706.1 DUF4126 domain-containing protein [Sphingobium phenoxybenzoativorans]
MDIVQILGVAASVSLLAGWRLYLCIFAVGMAMRFGWVATPEHLQALNVLSNGWIIGIAGTGAVAEFLADKVAVVDTVWDAVHTLVRPVGGALLALALVDAGDPAWQVATLLLGGGATLLTHSAKAGTRAIVNTSPEPFSNAIVSTGEDVVSGGMLIAVLANPVLAVICAAIILAGTIAALLILRRLLFRRRAGPPDTQSGRIFDPPAA